jgi:hypothetical protein
MRASECGGKPSNSLKGQRGRERRRRRRRRRIEKVPDARAFPISHRVLKTITTWNNLVKIEVRFACFLEYLTTVS